MKYLKKSFSVPAGSDKISQADWDRIFKPRPPCPRGKDHEVYRYSGGSCEYFCDDCHRIFTPERKQ